MQYKAKKSTRNLRVCWSAYWAHRGANSSSETMKNGEKRESVNEKQ